MGAVTLNADEVLTIAERIEANGARFYRRAAELHPEVYAHALMLRLAAMEDEHRAVFAAMRVALDGRSREETVSDPYREAALYLQALADAHPGEGAQEAAKSLNGQETIADILQLAIDLEKQSIIYYIGVIDLVPRRLGRDKVEAILGEEKRHVAILVEELKRIHDAGGTDVRSDRQQT